MGPVKRRKHSGGFSLTEVVASLGILAGVSLPLLGVLAIGLDDTKVAWDARTLGNLRATLAQHLQDPAWPEESRRGGAWTAGRTFDMSGRLMEKPGEGSLANVAVAMASQPGLGHANPWLECVRVTFRSPDTQEVLGQCVLQRLREPARTPP